VVCPIVGLEKKSEERPLPIQDDRVVRECLLRQGRDVHKRQTRGGTLPEQRLIQASAARESFDVVLKLSTFGLQEDQWEEGFLGFLHPGNLQWARSRRIGRKIARNGPCRDVSPEFHHFPIQRKNFRSDWVSYMVKSVHFS